MGCAGANINFVRRQVVQRFKHESERSVAERVFAGCGAFDEKISFEHRHCPANDNHRGLDWLEARIQELMLQPHFVEDVTHDGHEQFCSCECEELRVILPKRSHV